MFPFPGISCLDGKRIEEIRVIKTTIPLVSLMLQNVSQNAPYGHTRLDFGIKQTCVQNGDENGIRDS